MYFMLQCFCGYRCGKADTYQTWRDEYLEITMFLGSERWSRYPICTLFTEPEGQGKSYTSSVSLKNALAKRPIRLLSSKWK